MGSFLALAVAACGGGGGGGSPPPSAPANPPPSNAAPNVQAGADQTIDLPTATAQLSGSATDDSSTSTLTYTWSATSGPSGVTFGSANAAATSVTFPSAGTYVLTLSVSDGSATGTDTVTVTVNAAPSNAAPTVQAGADQSIEWPTATAQLSGSATDDSSTSTLTYTWSATSGPSGVTFGSANAAATSVTFPSAGAYVLTLSVSDGSATGTDAVAVTVNAAMYPASDTANGSADHGWTRVAAATEVGMNQTLLDQAATYAQTGGTAQAGNAGMIVRRGRLVHSWGDIDRRFDVKSTTKSMGGIALGLAIGSNTIALTDLAQARYADFGANPASNVTTGYLDDITIQQLATHTAGFSKTGRYFDPNNPTATTLMFAPGTTWSYSDGGLNWLAEVLTTVFNQDLASVLSAQVWTALGLNGTAGGSQNADGPPSSDIHWRDNQLRPNPMPGVQMEKRELASGIFANSNAMARVGLLFLRKGVWANDQRILPESFVTTVSTPPAANASLANADATNFPGATTDYGVLWWTNASGQLANVPRDAFWAWGLGDSLIVVIPSLDIVAVRAGGQAPINSSTGARVWNDDDWNGDYTVLAPFIEPIVQSVTP